MTTPLSIRERAADLFGDLATKDDVRQIVKEEIKPMSDRIDRLEDKVDHLEARFDHLEARFDNLEGKVGRIEGLVLNLIDSFNANTRTMEGALNAKGIPVKLKAAAKD